MKIYSKFLVFLALVSITSCSQSEENKFENEDQSFSSLEVKDELTNEFETKYPNFKYLKGDFNVIESDSDDLIIYTESKTRKHIFILNGVGKYGEIPHVNSVHYVKNGILINEKIFFSPKGKMSKSLSKDMNRFSNKSKALRKYEISSLVYSWIDKESPKFEDFSFTKLKNITKINEIKHEGGCDSGGEGSTGCSITSSTGTGCSVSCGAGTYACCVETTIGPNSCHCH